VVTRDFTTPQGALLVLEEAYRNRDLEAAVRAKSFEVEAELMLRDVAPDETTHPEMIRKTAELLEYAFRVEILDDGFPDFHGLTCSADSVEPYREGVVVVTERCRFPDGGHSVERILVAKIGSEWRVVRSLD
jgi:hypothetical protein